mmetsp:Transcript_17444/g.34726  ORF Transcript_17444/g.34726 Transcript_17444/m.34726 type:complete len:147 (-) Transcript_17444:202-642(-)
MKPFFFHLILALILATTAFACKCKAPTVSEKFDKGHYFIRVNIKNQQKRDKGSTDNIIYNAVFRWSYRGEKVKKKRKIKIETSFHNSACRVHFKENESYLLSVHDTDEEDADSYDISGCSNYVESWETFFESKRFKQMRRLFRRQD